MLLCVCVGTLSAVGTKGGVLYRLKNNHGISTMLQIFEIVFLVVADLLVLSFFEGVRENWLWYSRVEWLEREKEQKGMKTKEQIAAESLYWDSVVVQMIDKTFFQSLLINVLFER